MNSVFVLCFFFVCLKYLCMSMFDDSIIVSRSFWYVLFLYNFIKCFIVVFFVFDMCLMLFVLVVCVC